MFFLSVAELFLESLKLLHLRFFKKFLDILLRFERAIFVVNQ